MSTIFRTYKDFSNEKSTVELNVNGAILQAAIDAVWASVDAVSLGRPQATGLNVSTRLSNAPADSTTSQREQKIKVNYEDTVTFEPYYFTIPCIDYAQVIFVQNSDFLSLTDEPIASMVSVLETNVESPNGNPINIISVQFVGRNS